METSLSIYMHNVLSLTASVALCRIEAELEEKRLREREQLMRELQVLREQAQVDMDQQRVDYEHRLRDLEAQMV